MKTDQPETPFRTPTFLKRKLIIFFSLSISIGLICAALTFYYYEIDALRSAKHFELNSIAQLKIGQIQQWRQERINDARVLSEDRQLADAYNLWQRQSLESAKAKQYLLQRLESVKNNYDYHNILIITADGRTALSCRESENVQPQISGEPATTALSTKTVVFGGFYRCETCRRIIVNIFAPLIDSRGHAVAAVVLVVDPSHYLYPLIQSWPTPSRSSETLIIRRDGDDVLFLNELRHMSDTALKLKIPISQSNLPAAQAILGKKGYFQGKDYRNIEVLAVIQPIPDSNWFMVAKVDRREILAEARHLARELIIGIILALLVVGLSGGISLHAQQKKSYKRLFLIQLQLSETRKWYQTILYSIGDGVIATDALGRIRQMNPTAEKLTGWKEHDAVDVPLKEVFHIIDETSREVMEDPFSNITRKKHAVGMATQTLLISKDGRQYPIAHSGAPIRNPDDEIIGVVLVFRDRSKERKMETSLRESQTLLQSIMDNSPAMIYLLNEQETFLLVNQKLASVINRPVSDIIGKNKDQLDHKEIVLELTAGDQDIFKSKTSRLTEHDIQQMDGKYTYLIHRFPVFNAGGTVFAVGAIATDITHFRQIESDLRTGEAQYQALVQSAADHLYMLDLEGVYLSSNDRVKLLGFDTGRQIVGKTIEDVHTGENGELFRAKYEQVISRLESIRFEHCSTAPDGRRLEWEKTIYPIMKEDNSIVAVGGIARDITRYKTLEKQYRQAQKMEAIGQLAGGVAHDYNNMLGIIMGYAEMCVKDIEPQCPLYEDLNEILMAARRSKEITGQLLAFARQQTIAPKIIDANGFIRQSERMLTRLIGEDIELKISSTSLLWPIRIDPAQFHQILANLAINARDAVGGVGIIALEITNIVLDEGYCAEHIGFRCGEFVLISFTDSGMGMDKETITKIFEPFFTTKEKGKGTGLGLSTVYGIIKQNDGFINVHSEPGHGTTFKIFLPRATGEYDDLSEDVQEKITGNETILVVDDEIQILRLCQRALKPLGYTVLTAQSPDKAIAACRTTGTPIDLLLSDVILPTQNGKELAGKIKALRPSTKLLFMSGYTANAIADRGILIEGINFIPKPFSPNELATKIRNVLDQ